MSKVKGQRVSSDRPSNEELLSSYEVFLARKTRSGLSPWKASEFEYLRRHMLERIERKNEVLFEQYEMLVSERARNGGLKPAQQLTKDKVRKQIIEMMGKNHS